MNIWIDLANSPHVLFFIPIINELEKQGHDIVITVRDYAQTVDLAKSANLNFKTIGNNTNKTLLSKVTRLTNRVIALIGIARQAKPSIDLAISHNSYAQLIAAKFARIPSITFMDYEYQPANHIAFRLAKQIFVPYVIPDAILNSYGAKQKKLNKYNGLKEELYLCDFVPNSYFFRELSIDESKPIVVLRPPATGAIYHRFDNDIYNDLLVYLGRLDATIVVLPRDEIQIKLINSLRFDNFYVTESAIDGKNLIYHADLVISGGGTMNREAAVFGTPVYSFFKGHLGAVDKWLIENGKMTLIEKKEEFPLIVIEKKKEKGLIPKNNLLSDITMSLKLS